MEKKIKFEDVVAFIEKAMEKGYFINLDYYEEEHFCNHLSVTKQISANSYKTQDFSWKQEDGKLYIIASYSYTFSKMLSNYIIEVVDRKDVLKWGALMEEVIDYTHRKLENTFNNFFNEEEFKPTDINDLDDKDD